MTRRRYAAASSGVSVLSRRRFTPTSASAGSTLICFEPRAIVNAAVVRSIAFSSLPSFSAAAHSTGPKHHRFASTTRRPNGVCGASVASISLAGFVRCAGKGWDSQSAAARHTMPSADGRSGWLAWPPADAARSRTFIMPFSPMPTTAMGSFTPGNTPSTTAPPSSSTMPGFTPRRRSSAMTSFAPWPFTSSSPPNAKYTSRPGTKPCFRSASAASRMPSSVIFVSSVPRPHSSLSNTSPQNGGCAHLSASTGTTS